MALKPFKLYTIEGMDYAVVIARYRYLCEEGTKDFDDTSISVTGPSEFKYITKKAPRKPLRDDTRILNKIKYVVHSIAYRQQTNPEESADGVSINMAILQDVIGEDAFELIPALVETGYITRSSVFEIGKFSRKYKALRTIKMEPCTNATIRKYIEKTKQKIDDTVIERLTSPEFKTEYGDKFAQIYIKNLNKFKLSNKKGFESFAHDQIKQNPNTEAYYDFIRSTFEERLKIYRIDDNHRIYHVLTSLKRELKPYLNIRYSIDCANSHPLLFNYFIFISKKINIHTAYRISEVLSLQGSLVTLSKDYSHPYSNAYFINNIAKTRLNDAGSDAIGLENHYNTKNLRNILIDNGIKKADIDKFEPDELVYIWKTSCGIFWDDVLLVHQDEGLSRSEIKQKMFAEVFYSKTTEDIWKRFCLEFKAQFPHVYDLILKWKEPLRNPEQKAILLRRNKAVNLGNRTLMKSEATALPNIMMDLESAIFRDILNVLFAKRISAVHIHDAIVIPKVRGTEKVDASTVVEVMKDVYRRYGLSPTFKVESYV